MINLLFEVSPVDASGNIVTIRMSSAYASKNGVKQNGYQWLPLITRQFNRTVEWSQDGEVTETTVSYNSIAFNMSPDFENEIWDTYHWNGALARAYRGNDGDDFSSYVQVYEGTVGSIARDGQTADLPLLGTDLNVDRPILTQSYAGTSPTGGAEGQAALRGTLKPWAAGRCQNIEPIKVDPVNLIWQYHGYGRTAGVDAVYENVLTLGAPVATVSSWSELIAATVAEGQWIAAPAIGAFRLGSNPTGKITADIRGALESDGSYPTAVGTIMAMLIKKTGLAASRIAPSLLARSESWNLYLDSQSTVGDELRSALLACGCASMPTSDGKYGAVDAYSLRTPMALDEKQKVEPIVRSVRLLSVAAPVYQVNVQGDRCWSVHTEGEVSQAVGEISADLVAKEAAIKAARDLAAQAIADGAANKARIDAIDNDGLLDRSEKANQNRLYDKESGDHVKLMDSATEFDVAVQRAAYDNAWNNLTAFLNALSPAFRDLSQATPITSEYAARWLAYDNAKINLTTAMTGDAYGAVVGENLTDLNGNFLGRDDVLNSESSFNALVTVDFSAPNADPLQGVSSAGTNLTVTNGIMKSTPTATDNMIYVPVNKSGKDVSIIRVLARPLGNTPTWQGQIYYNTGTQGESEGFTKKLPQPELVPGKWIVLEWDMRALTAGGSNYLDNPIKFVRLDLEQSATSVWEIDKIQFGNRAGSSLGAPDGTLVGGVPAQSISNAVKDANGIVKPARDQIADAKVILDAAVQDAKKAGTDASAAAAQVRTDLDPKIVDAKKAGTDALAAAAKVQTDLTPTIAAAKKAGDDAATTANKASTDLTAEVTRAKGAEGTLTTSVQTAQGRADAAHTAISTETTQRTGADSALGQRIDTVTATANTDRSNAATAVSNEVTARSNADGALGRRIDTVETDYKTAVGTTNTRIEKEEIASATRDEALGRRTTSIESTSNAAPTNSVNANPMFNAWVDGARFPTGWIEWVTNGSTERAASESNAPGTYSLYYNVPAGKVHAVSSTGLYTAAGAYILEAEVYLASGTYNGAGVTLGGILNLDFAGDPDINGVISATGPARRKFSKYVEAPNALDNYKLHPMANWDSFGRPMDAKAIYFSRCAVRPATAGEILAKKADVSLNGTNGVIARVTTEETTRARNDEALGVRINTTEAKLSGSQDSELAARIRNEETTRVTNDTALGVRTGIVEASSAKNNSMAANPEFSRKWDDFYAPNWQDWSNGGTAKKVLDNGGNTVRFDIGAGDAGWFTIVERGSGGWFVLEASIRHNSGNLSGSGLHIHLYDAGGNPTGKTAELAFAGDPTSTGATGGGGVPGGGQIKWSKLVFIDAPAIGGNAYFRLHMMANWSGLGGLQAKNIDFQRVSMRAASQGEIDGRQAKIDATAISARVTNEETTRIRDDQALAGRTSTVESKLEGTTPSPILAKITDNYSTLAGVDQALAGRANTIEAQMRGETDSTLAARIRDEAATRVRDDAAVATRTSALETSSIGAGNLLSNTEFQTLDGWTLTWGSGLTQNAAGTAWQLGGVENNLSIHDTTANRTGYNEVQSTRFAVESGAFIQFYALTSAHRSRAWVSLFFYDSNGTNVGYAGENFGARVDAGGQGIGAQDYTGLKSFQVPSGAVSAVMILRQYVDTANRDPYSWFARPYVGQAKQGQTGWNPYSPGSAKNSILASNAAIRDEATTRSTQTDALGTRLNATEAKLNNTQGSALQTRIQNEETARSTAIDTVGRRATALESKVSQTPVSFIACSVGYAAYGSLPAGAEIGISRADGTILRNNGRSYGVYVFDSSNTIIASNSYDVYADGNQRQAMADFLNGVTTGQAVIITTNDEPANGRFERGLQAAMWRVGAGALFDSPNFMGNSAYILIGRAGIGRGNGQESYRGDYGGDPNAWLEQRFELLNGVPLIGNGAGAVQAIARIGAEETTRATQTDALSSRQNVTEAKLNGSQDSELASRIRNAETARVNGDQAIATRTGVLEVAAKISSNSTALNDKFTMWTDGQAYPQGWMNWQQAGNFRTERQTINGGAYLIRTLNDYADVDSGFFQIVPIYNGKWVVEVTVESDQSGLRGAGVTLHGQYSIDFLSDPDTTGYVGDSGNGVIRSFTKMFDITGFSNINFHAMHGWSGFNRGVQPRYMKWYRLALRPASAGEILAGKVNNDVGTLTTRIQNEETARTTAVDAVGRRTNTLESNYGTVRSNLDQWNNDRYQDFLRVDARVGVEESTRATAVNAISSRTSTVEAAVTTDSNSLIRNAIFNAPGWTTTTAGAPPNWAVWSQDNSAYIGGCPSQASKYGAVAPLQIDRNGNNNGVTQGLGPQAQGWYVIDIDVYAEDGNWSGSGVHLQFNNGYALNFHFASNADTGGRYGDIGAANRKFSYMFYNGAPSTGANFYLMAGWTGFTGSGGYGFVRTIWHKAVVRPATDGEVKAQRVIDANLIARTGITESAVADANTKLASARLELTAVAGNNRAQITLRSNNNSGAGVDIVGDVNFSGNLNVGADSGGNRVKITNTGMQVYGPSGLLQVRLGIW